ncbi:AI-2E family transporter [Blochmannia endosymbiont of Camponotus sp.]|uniref:AI-2E family transporter n=1 Tax=Blochmannia endosymbiont of Camponotus sp. TaxID=700220 RepID=UPI0020256943|nr:AI-2E family transporter [Blochmannia endosymbiont of Camponotus sp.]URJ29770.1 AI-2E family transporter [Blochmannia endosymbiont of Camponotus sp.]URJ31330.1 AI-2E family transporter [Blochmannia endosymbiont of Camponotus sp.]
MISQDTSIIIISYIIMFTGIMIIIPLGLFPCFFSGFLTYEIIVSSASYFERFVGINRARWAAVILITISIAVIITIGIINCTNFFTEDINKISISIEINRIFSDLKKRLPDFLPSFLPNTTEELKDQIFNWIESNLILIRNMGHTFLHGFITLLIGLVIGILVSCTKSTQNHTNNTYFTIQLSERIYNLSQAFRNIVFAQIKISLVNTLLTSIMIFILLPLIEKSLPLGKTLIIITFILGMLPIIGNLISNIMITISALSISLSIGIIMFVYLILIHKLEYFLNAEIIGNRINANPWELILSMLFLEAIFGLEGLIAAPIFYAYLKIELRLKKLI